MAATSSIEWTDATWNPITGCSVVSPGCTNCYAMKLAGTRLKNLPSRAGLTQMTKAGPVWNGEIRVNWQWIDQPLGWAKPRRVFACAHGDLFHEGVPFDVIAQVFSVMIAAVHLRGHTFQVLTKRAGRMREVLNDPAFWDLANDQASMEVMERCDSLTRHSGDARATLDDYGVSNPPPGIWLGVSAEDQPRLDERAYHLLQTPAALRYLSVEPMIGPMDLRGFIRSAGLGLRKWDTFTWPYWVPSHTRGEIEGFWRAEWGRGPDEWLRSALRNGHPPLGAGGEYHRVANLEPLVSGRFVSAWNNIGRAISDDGATYVVSHGRWTAAPYLDWVILGGESGDRPMHPAWPRLIRDQCRAAGVPFFFKQWGDWEVASDENGGRHGYSGSRMPETGERFTWIGANGVRVNPSANGLPDAYAMARVGKKAAGRLLDGVEHNGMPELARG